jgi:hypothetical protein
MKNQFIGYYQPTSEEYSKLWQEALIVLDTNILLSLYKLPVSARDEVLGVLEKLKGRLWIPYHVALGFQRGRLSVIASERKAVDDVLNSTNDLINEVKNKFDTLQIDKRNIDVDANALIAELNKVSGQLVDAIKKAHSSQLDISSSDSIRSRIDALIGENVGPRPSTQTELEQLVVDGEGRFDNKIPPGFKDADKSRNPAEANFIFDGLKYQRKFGDLIIWRQIIAYAKSNNIKSILFITADNKEDWWWREQGKTIGPRPELTREIFNEGGVELFWMYSSVQFVEQANKYVSAEVSEDAVNELQNVVIEQSVTNVSRDTSGAYYYSPPRDMYRDNKTRSFSSEANFAKEAVGRWLRDREGYVKENRRFPDFIVMRGEGPYGYDMRLISNFNGRFFASPVVADALLRGYLETREGRLVGFTLVIVIPEIHFFEINSSNIEGELANRLRRLLEKYPVNSIVVGTVIDGDFTVLTHQKSNGRSSKDDISIYLE